jgi:hypothetical protein
VAPGTSGGRHLPLCLPLLVSDAGDAKLAAAVGIPATISSAPTASLWKSLQLVSSIELVLIRWEELSTASTWKNTPPARTTLVVLFPLQCTKTLYTHQYRLFPIPKRYHWSRPANRTSPVLILPVKSNCLHQTHLGISIVAHTQEWI